MSPTIDVLVTPDCPHAEETIERVGAISDRLAPESPVHVTTVRDARQAASLEFPGSPTIRIDGSDLEGTVPATLGLACRTYADGCGAPPTWLVEAGLLRARQPRHVLFLCVANSARSQLAEGIGHQLAPLQVRVSSAGSEPTEVRPQAVRALAELGIDSSHQRSKSLDEFADAGVDCVITLCAEENCPAWLGDAWRAHWPLPDPAAATGTDEEVMESYRAVRDEIRRRLAVLFRP